MDMLKWLQEWYEKNCNGCWEHLYGIKIYNIDNPGWKVLVDLSETPWEDACFEKIVVFSNENDWIHCSVKDCVFSGSGDMKKLTEILMIFRNWVEQLE